MRWGLSFEEAVRLHGHVGPWLALGYKVGSYAREKLRVESPLSVKCTAFLPKKAPYSCAIDGIQASFGCTAGKLNLEIVESRVEDISFLFVNTESGRAVRLRLREGLAKLIEELASRRGLGEAAEEVLRMDLQRLVEEVEGSAPP
ncbi:MAG: formylmethanofuran dehydrogenase subunit E family protein [Candidatus Nezhaarchaeota archaeon]|nr:formylmethanofuran dehydrogenase subunit E family protein [Candidatus Nezhaarchaeota archaeon]